MTVLQGSGLEEFAKLNVTQCSDLLRGQSIGRLGYVADGLKPVIVPVRYAYNGRDIAFAVSLDEGLEHIPLSWVALEIDGMDMDGKWGWTVSAAGCAFDITESIDEYAEELREMVLGPYYRERGEHAITIHVKILSGRCFGSSSLGGSDSN